MDSRSLTWLHLLPRGESLRLVAVAPAVRKLLAEREGTSGRILVTQEANSANFSTVDGDRGVVLINPGAGIKAMVTREFKHTREYIVLPGLRNARWYLPIESPHLCGQALRTYSPHRFVPKLLKSAYLALARMGMMAVLGDRLVLALREPTPMEEFLGAACRADGVRLAVSSGTPGPARKATIQIMDREAHTLGFAKIADNDRSRSLLRNEAEILSRIQGHCHAPTLLHYSDDGQVGILVQTPVGGRRGPRQFNPLYEHFLNGLLTKACGPVGRSQFLVGLGKRVDGVVSRHPEVGATLRSAFATLRQECASTPCPTAICHGDFAPWNVMEEAGHAVPFDWEYGSYEGLPLLDAIHFHLRVRTLLHRQSVETAGSELISGKAGVTLRRLASEQGVRQDLVVPFIGIEVLNIAVTALEDGHSPAVVSPFVSLLAHLPQLRKRGVNP